MKHIWLLTELTAVFAGTALAQTNAPAPQQITGAFGVVLGTKVNLSQYKPTGYTTDKVPMYEFTPKNPVEGLTRYYFQATPKTGRIYCVWAIGDAENDGVCKKKQAVLRDLLKKKYGEEEKQGLRESFSDAYRIQRGTRSIVIKCSGFMDVTLNLYYTDDDLEKEAEKERIELEGKKTNDSGL